MSVQLSPLAEFIFGRADAAVADFETEEEFFATFDVKVLAQTVVRGPGVAAAIAEIVNAGRWPWAHS